MSLAHCARILLMMRYLDAEGFSMMQTVLSKREGKEVYRLATLKSMMVIAV